MSLTLIIGCMFSGKTTKLIEFSEYYRKLNKKIMGINFIKNTRYDSSSIITHNKSTFNFDFELSVSKLDSIILDEYYSSYKLADVLIIDEIQFYPDAYTFINNSINKDNKIIICAGLNDYYNKKPFEQISFLIPEADEIHYLQAQCKCGEKASFSKKLIKTNNDILIGSSESYIPVCRTCYNINKK